MGADNIQLICRTGCPISSHSPSRIRKNLIKENRFVSSSSRLRFVLFHRFFSVTPPFVVNPPATVHISPEVTLVFILNSLVYLGAFFLYVKAISVGEVSLVAPLYNFSLLFLFAFSSIFLHEKITVYRVLGGIVIFFRFFVFYPGTILDRIGAIPKSRASFQSLCHRSWQLGFCLNP